MPSPLLQRFAVDDRGTHDVYGLGRVIAVEGWIAALGESGSTRTRILGPYAKTTKP
ncbi:hypothetical protein [Streptomyces sp. NPDC057238]|uniref:hypothetical protein n=1 Tax=unclassified Streptomyces TaxID=2593676 RepID=UPI00267F87EF